MRTYEGWEKISKSLCFLMLIVFLAFLFDFNDTVTWPTVIFVDSLVLYLNCYTESMIVKGSRLLEKHVCSFKKILVVCSQREDMLIQ